MTELSPLTNNIPVLFSIFISGAVCITMFSRLALKKFSYIGFFFRSVTLGLVIKHFVDWIISHIEFHISIFNQTVICSIVGCAFAILYFMLKNHVWVRWKAAKYFGVDTADNIWTRHIDPEGRTYMLLYLDDGTYTLGCIENADDDYITLSRHCSANAIDEVLDKESERPTDSIICVPMSHVKRFEFLYKNKDSHLARWCLH